MTHNQKVRNTSPPKNTKLINMKSIRMPKSLYSYYSLVSSVFPWFAPSFAFPPNIWRRRVVASGPDPKMSSQVKFRVNSAGNRPIPIMKPPLPLLLPNKPPFPPAKF
jgi:hypothetical protein